MAERPRQLFARLFGLDTALLQGVLTEALRGGGDFADVYLEARRATSLQIEENLLKESRESVSLGAGIRVLAGEQSGYAYTNDLTAEALRAAARVAAQIASGPARVNSEKLQSLTAPARYPLEQPAALADLRTKSELLFAANQAARAADARVQEVQVGWGDELRLVLIANSEGEYVDDIQPLFTFSVSVVAERNQQRQVGWKNLGMRAGMEAFTRARALGLAREAVEQAARLLEAQPAPAGELPVVLAAGASGVLLHESVGHPLEADFNRKQLSVFSGRLGEKVASALCTVIDDATLVGLRGSLNIDGEGTIPQRPTLLIQEGRLVAYLQDRLSARLMKLAPTGNGRRQDYSCIPIPRMTNTYLAAGTSQPEEILQSVSRGIYCKSFTGGQVEPAAGKFTFSMHEAYLIDEGRLTHPVKGATLIGSGIEVLNNITMVGHDLELDRGAWSCGKEGQGAPVGVGTPTVKIAKITVGGR